MICYKYTKAEYAFNALVNRRLKVSRPSEFNDIFEFCPTSDPHSLVRKVISDSVLMDRLYKKEVANGYGMSFDYFKQNDVLPTLFENLYPQLPSLFQRDLAAREQASKYIGVICLSRSSMVYLLWSHYADSHKGCVIGLDVLHDCFTRTARVNERVQYEKKRPSFAWDLQGREYEEQIIRITKTKSIAWSYEREHRLAFPLEELQESDGRLFIELHPKAVRRIIYGPCMDKDFKRGMDDVLNHPDFSHVFRYAVVPDAQRYTIRLEYLGNRASS